MLISRTFWHLLPISSTTSTSNDEADTLGMWAFLATEVLFFGGLIAA